MKNFFNLFTMDMPLSVVFDATALIFFVIAVLLLLMCKLIFDWITPYNIDEQLLEKDNKAIAISFSGFLGGLCIVIASVIVDESAPIYAFSSFPLLQSIIETFIWCVIGMGLLALSMLFNDRFLLFSFSNRKKMVGEGNRSVGIAVFASLISSSIIIRPLVTGDPIFFNPFLELLAVFLFFIVAQALMVVFAKLYSGTSGFDLQSELKKDNLAAAISFGFHLIAIAWMIADITFVTNSIVIVCLYFVNGCVMLLLTRYLFDKLLFHHSKISSEIVDDQNYGIAFVEGLVVVGISLILTASL